MSFVCNDVSSVGSIIARTRFAGSKLLLSLTCSDSDMLRCHRQTLLQQLTTPDQEARCTLDELSAVLPNVARLKSARVQLLDSTGFSQCILTAFANNSMPRKEGYVKALRNCLLKMKVGHLILDS